MRWTFRDGHNLNHQRGDVRTILSIQPLGQRGVSSPRPSWRGFPAVDYNRIHQRWRFPIPPNFAQPQQNVSLTRVVVLSCGLRMSLSALPLSYCTNVHPGRSWPEVLNGLERYTWPIRQRCGREIAAGLWLAQPVVYHLLQEPASRQQLRDWLTCHQIPCYTLNAFPYGDFHSDRVKEQVYLPDWTTSARAEYTLACARLLADLLPPSTAGSLSTLPLGFKALAQAPDFLDQCVLRLKQVARDLQRLQDETGKTIRLAIEPEPLCVLETTAETVAFFHRLRESCGTASEQDAVETFLGVCFDVCHQAVEFEDVAASLRQLVQASIRVNKMHISCALHVAQPAEPSLRAALASYIEPRYLHQTFARSRSGAVWRYQDLDERLITQPPEGFLQAEAWRVHFHVPVDAERLGPLHTTRPDLLQALAVLPELSYAPHLEVETYTWEVLPGGEKQNLVDGLAQELLATAACLDRLASEGQHAVRGG